LKEGRRRRRERGTYGGNFRFVFLYVIEDPV
jgi:hypothetical protein